MNYFPLSVPVSHPVLTFRIPRVQAEVGDMVGLHCEALRGSPPILYQFYHEDIILGNSSAPSGGGASFNLSLTAEHSGNYSCEADNGQGAQRSEVVTLNFTGIASAVGLSPSASSPAPQERPIDTPVPLLHYSGRGSCGRSWRLDASLLASM